MIFFFLFLIILSSCKENKIHIKPVSYAQFEEFINHTKYITDAERYGWSIVQIDVVNFRKETNANWKNPMELTWFPPLTCPSFK